MKEGRAKCPHIRRKCQCKDCGGSSICEHNRQRSTCKQCGGASICEHNRQRSGCKHCGGVSICEHEHNRRRSTCKQCGAQVALLLPPLLPECWWWLGMVDPVEKQMATEEQMVAYDTSALLLEGHFKLN